MISTDLGDQLEAFVAELVSSGRYASKTEVLREGVRLMQEREARRAEFDALIRDRIAEADAGLGVPAEQVFDELEARYRKLRAG